jgi:transposase-like protein
MTSSPPLSGKLSPLDLKTRGLEDMSNASLQRSVKADVRRRMSPPMGQSVARISEELGIHLVTLYNWRKGWRLQGEVVPASEKVPGGWSAAECSQWCSRPLG